MRISGVPVGRVKTIEPDNETGRSIVVIELESRYAPMPSDARAILRQKTLLGETYVELTPGSPDAEPVPEGGSLPESQVSPTVQLDEIYRTFDAETRAAFQTWMQEQATAIGEHGRDVNDALGNLGPFAEDAAELVDILNRQEGARHQPGRQHRRGVRGADRARRPAAVADRELQSGLRRPPRRATSSSRRPSSRCRPSSASRRRPSSGWPSSRSRPTRW